MKKVFVSLMSAVACMVFLAGCGENREKGQLAAQQLTDAWGNADAVAQVANNYIAMRDSMGGSSVMDYAFIEACSANDSIKALAQAIALTPEAVGKARGEIMVKGLQDGTLDANGASAMLGVMGDAYAMLGRSNDLAACFAAVDEVASNLSDEQQMQVYARSCTPQVLAESMKEERRQGDAAQVDRKAKVVETILQGEDLNAFKSIYYSK